MTLNWMQLAAAALLFCSCEKFTSLGGQESLASAAQEPCGYQQNAYGERVSWKGKLPVTIYLDSSLPQEYDVSIQQAATIWQKIAGKALFQITRDPNITADNSAHVDKNFISFANTWDPDRQEQQATTTIYWSDSTLYKSATIIDGQYFNFYTGDQDPTGMAVHMPSLMVHELGHVLGLVHVTVQPTVMFPTLASATEDMNPSTVDEGHLTCEY